MNEFRFDPREPTPLVSCLLTGPKRSGRVLLVFDTGCAKTQVRLATLHELGFTDTHRFGTARAIGVEGIAAEGPVFRISRLFLFGKKFIDVPVAAFPMAYFQDQQIDGLLG